jgi:hypothetical protein
MVSLPEHGGPSLPLLGLSVLPLRTGASAKTAGLKWFVTEGKRVINGH